PASCRTATAASTPASTAPLPRSLTRRRRETPVPPDREPRARPPRQARRAATSDRTRAADRVRAESQAGGQVSEYYAKGGYIPGPGMQVRLERVGHCPNGHRWYRIGGSPHVEHIF